jgi:hypothetical protein
MSYMNQTKVEEIVASAANKGSKKRVYGTDEIPHLWAHKAVKEATNQQRNLYFDGDTIFSYGSHFPIARHVVSPKGKHKGKRAVIMTDRTHSVTTAKHLHAVKMAYGRWNRQSDKWELIPGIDFEFHIEPSSLGTWGKFDTTRTLDAYGKKIERALESIGQPKIRQHTRADRWGEAERLIAEANLFAEFFGERRKWKMPASVAVLAEELKQAKAKQEAKERKQREIQFKKDQQVQEERQQRIKETLPRWIAGETVDRADYELITWHLSEAYLRVSPKDADMVETSKGVEIPLTHAYRVMRLIRYLLDNRQPDENGMVFKRNGKSIRIGYYQVDSVLADGTIHAGCHTVTGEEFRRFADVLGELGEKREEMREQALGELDAAMDAAELGETV